MSDLILGLELYKKNKLIEAEQYLKNVIESTEEKYDIEELESCFSSLININFILKKDHRIVEFKLLYVEFLFTQKEDYSRASELYEELFHNSIFLIKSIGVFLYSAYRCSVLSGHVKNGEIYAEHYLNYLLKYKKVTLGLSFLEEVIDDHVSLEDGTFFHLEFLLLIEDINSIDELLNNLAKDYIDGSVVKWSSKVNDSDIFAMSRWRKSSALYELLLIKSIEGQRESKKTEELKKFLDLLYEYLLFFPERLFGIIIALDYGLMFSKKRFLLTVVTFYNRCGNILFNMDESKNQRLQKEKMVSAIKEKIKRIDSLEDDANDEIDYVDLYGDLVDSAVDIEWKDHDKYVEDELGRERVERGHIIRLPDDRSTEEIRDDLIEEINKFIKKGNDFVSTFILTPDEKIMIKEMASLQKSVFVNIYKDLIVSFNMMKMWEVSFSIIGLVAKRKIIKDVKQELEFNYLKLMVLIGKGELLSALELAEYITIEMPLNSDEKICFLYVRAEILNQLGFKRESLEIYRMISKGAMNYRLVKERLSKLE